MGKIDEIHQAERHGQSHGQDEKQHPERETIKKNNDDVADHEPSIHLVSEPSRVHVQPSEALFFLLRRRPRPAARPAPFRMKKPVDLLPRRGFGLSGFSPAAQRAAGHPATPIGLSWTRRAAGP
ncbi:hypothetical protein GCM10023174_20830 [Chelativorans composti]